MKTITSFLEKNIFNGITIKKGLNNLTNSQFEKAMQDAAFATFVDRGLIREIAAKTPDEKRVVASIKPDFDTMAYAELKKYVKANDIKAASQSKADLLAAIKNYKKGE